MRDKQERETPCVLLVLPPSEHRRALLNHLESLGLRAIIVDTCREVRDYLQSYQDLDIIITQVSLRDGNWSDVLGCLARRGVRVPVVVSSQVADERFWSEVLWRGVYDVLLEPYDQKEVRRIVLKLVATMRDTDSWARHNTKATNHVTPEPVA